MKPLKSITLVLLIAFIASGCYTQLEYSQRVKRITDEQPKGGYSWNGDSEDSAETTYEGEYREEEYYQDEDAAYTESGYEDEGYIPVYYKDYNTANWWSSCYCSPYSSYSYNRYYNDPWYHSSYASPWYGHYSTRFHISYAGFYSPYHHSPWKWRHFGFRYHHGLFALGFHWGSPYHYYWDYPYYSYSGFLSGPYWGGYYYRPYWYGSRYHYGGYYGHGGSKASVRNRSYRPRSIGSDRVVNRNRGNDSRIRTENRTSSTPKTRVRNSGSTRVNRGAVQQDRTRVQQPRTRGTSRVGVQSRSNTGSTVRNRGTVQERSQPKQSVSGTKVRNRGSQQRINSDNRQQRSSSVGASRTRIQSRTRIIRPVPPAVNRNIDRSSFESRVRQQRVAPPKESNSSNRSSFFGRVGNIFKNSSPNTSSVRSNNVYNQRSRSGSSSTRISRPQSPSRSSVTRSSSSSSRSRGTTGSSRSSSSSSRSRGNN